MKIMNIKKPLIIGMIHLPETLTYKGWLGLKGFVDKAKKDLKALEAGGMDAALIENDADCPCQVKGSADVVAPMTVVAYELAKIAEIPLGVEVLLNDPKASLAIAKTCGLKFIRTDYFVDRMTRKGYGEFKIDTKDIMNYKKKIHAQEVKVYADIQVKHAMMVNNNKTISLSVKQAIKAGADGIIVSGTVLGEKPLIEEVKEAKKVAEGKAPVIVGSGFSKSNAKGLLKYADWAIVGTSIKTNGVVDVQKVKELVNLVKGDV
jgi:uncharacterized protein